MSSTNLFKLIERITNLVRSEDRKKYAAIGLQPVHVQVLEYLSACNRFSDTPAAVADFLGLTKGTISQSIQVLERKNYLVKTPDSEDGRVVHLTLSEQGNKLLDGLKPTDVFEQAQKMINGKGFSTIEDALCAVLVELQKANQAKSFGVCHTCVNFIEKDHHYHCKLTDLPLSREDSTKICREHVLLEPTAKSSDLP